MLPKRLSLVPVQAGIAAFVSVPVAALVFVAALRRRRHGRHPARHASSPRWSACTSLIGIGEGVITFLAVGAIIAVRPDLVYGARPMLAERKLEIRTGAVA